MNKFIFAVFGLVVPCVYLLIFYNQIRQEDLKNTEYNEWYFLCLFRVEYVFEYTFRGTGASSRWQLRETPVEEAAWNMTCHGCPDGSIRDNYPDYYRHLEENFDWMNRNGSAIIGYIRYLNPVSPMDLSKQIKGIHSEAYIWNPTQQGPGGLRGKFQKEQFNYYQNITGGYRKVNGIFVKA